MRIPNSFLPIADILQVDVAEHSE